MLKRCFLITRYIQNLGTLSVIPLPHLSIVLHALTDVLFHDCSIF